ncbi:hypothetical protein EV146_110198 [Mesobacillus foraminis]|uniref:Uncharacterized protein n=1 Tax=Mesobacillus foraminis TaxID=279826 RepID=A0A4R2B9K3_9BACI|nr:hypothetical protein EV146_110198 [Mesobacillus foraminis]
MQGCSLYESVIISLDSGPKQLVSPLFSSPDRMIIDVIPKLFYLINVQENS